MSTNANDNAVLTARRFFHRWDHRHGLHRTLVKAANRGLRLLPLEAKYRVMGRRKAREKPYDLVADGDLVIQVGAPFDTLHSGRSRGFHLALRAGSKGSSVVIEPHPVSVREYREAAKLFGLQMEVVEGAVAAEQGLVSLRYDPGHPATNFVDGVAEYSEDEKDRFESVEVRADQLDRLVGDLERDIKVLSITTNGAEFLALDGAPELLRRTEYVALAGPDRTVYDKPLEQLGFKFLSFDDRGVTYARA